MTQLRKFRDSISNYFDEIERGVGKRGSTFTDVDAVTHDLDTHRFLFREFKRDSEPLNKAQLWVLRDLAQLPRCKAWVLRRYDNDLIGFSEYPDLDREIVLTVVQYRAKLKAWWDNAQIGVLTHDTAPLTAADIPW